jgi:hypothetical protein
MRTFAMRTLAVRALAVCTRPSAHRLARRADTADERVIRCAFC